MLTCTFFGHKDTPDEIKPALRSILVDLIEDKNVLNFYVGNHGSFDCMVKNCLIELKNFYPIDCAVVLAYLPGSKRDPEEKSPADTVYPDGIETVPRKFAINYRNEWMIERADYVVTYVKHAFGGAAQFKKLAERKNKTVINIAHQSVPKI